MVTTEEVFAKSCHIEIIPPKQDSEKLESDLKLFASKLGRVMDSGFTASITDNAMGLLAFQGHECIEELSLAIKPEQILIHLNTFHTTYTRRSLGATAGKSTRVRCCLDLRVSAMIWRTTWDTCD